jgi:hypothetical protein
VGFAARMAVYFPLTVDVPLVIPPNHSRFNDSKRHELQQALHKKTRKPYSGAGFEGLNDTE